MRQRARVYLVFDKLICACVFFFNVKYRYLLNSRIRIDGGPGKFRTQRLTLLDLTPQRAMYEIKQTDREERRTKKNQKAEEVKDKHR